MATPQRRKTLPRSVGSRLSQDAIARTIDGKFFDDIFNGIHVEVDLVSGTNVVNHKLGRKPSGYIVTKVDAALIIFDTASDTDTITITADAAATAIIWFF